MPYIRAMNKRSKAPVPARSPYHGVIDPKHLLVKTSAAIAYFGSKSAMARALDIKRASISAWGRTLPPLRSWQARRIAEAAGHADRFK